MRRVFRRLLVVAVVLTMCIGLFQLPVYAEDAGGSFGTGITWSITNNVLTVSGTGDMPESGSVPWSGYNSSLTKVIIKNGITSICEAAFFRASNLGNATIPDSVAKIGDNAFDGCKSLTRVMLPENLKKLGYKAFSECSGIRTVNIPDGVTVIGDYCFQFCSSLESISIPASVETVEQLAFYGCDNLKTADINAGEIVNQAFADCERLSVLTIGDNVKTIGWGAFAGSGITELTLGNSVEYIDACAFENCRSLSSLTISDSVKTIETCAFCNCPDLKKVSVPASVTSIGPHGFGFVTQEMIDDDDEYYDEYYLIDGFEMEVQPGSAAEAYAFKYGIIDGSPKFLVQPKNASAAAGAEVSFAVKCENVVSYQWWIWDTEKWFKATKDYTGYNKRKLTFTAAADMNGWRFLCKVKGRDGTYLKSDWVSLKILKPAKILVQPKAVSAGSGTRVRFAVKAENAKAYRWQYNDGSGWKNLSSSFTGYNTRELTFKALAARNGWKIRCRVKGQDGIWVNSTGVKLTVK